MQVLLTDLTRMASGFICCAGIDLATGKRVRPVIPGRRLTAEMLSVSGGPLDIRRVVEIGDASATGEPPEIEDHAFNRCRHVQTLIGPAFLAHLRAAALSGLDAFGSDLAPLGHHGRALDAGQGARSLVIVRLTEPVEVLVTRGSLRARWPDGLDLAVTDIRLFEADHRTPAPARIRWLRGRLARDPEVYACLGLSRPFQRSADDRPRHWLQLNNLHLSTALDWQLRWPDDRYALR